MLIISHRWQVHRQAGGDMIEVDVRRRNGELVLSHDRPGQTEQLTTLRELLETASVPLNLELKETGMEAEILQAIANFSSKVLISSKYPSILKKLRALDENIRLGLILGRANFFLLLALSGLDKQLKLYSVHPKSFLINQQVVRRLKRLGKQIFVWTVNDPRELAKLKHFAIDGVFTDYPNLFK